MSVEAHDGLRHLLAADPILEGLIGRLDDTALAVVIDPARGGRHPPLPAFAALVRVIAGQQVSVAAAHTMVTRLALRFDGVLPDPAQILGDDPEALRAAAGLSRGKLRCILALADAVQGGRLDLSRLEDLDDEAVAAALRAIPGIGPWTAQVYLMGHLARPDVLAPGDVGIRRAVGIAYDLTPPPSAETLVDMARPWRPHRSTACRLLWTSLDVPPQAR